MSLNFIFFFNSLLLGVGLAMDAFSVSVANGLHEPGMKGRKMCAVAGIFGLFQGLMPLLGWFCIHSLVQYFSTFAKLVPWIALALLSYIGAKMILDSLHECPSGDCCTKLTVSALLLQGIATSIDALSVGFTIADYDLTAALLAAAMICAITFVICMAGLLIGKTVGNKLSGKAGVFGGVILIAIGLEIFITSFF